jgi:tRNA (guanine37-N1)-methyltransferase
MTSSDPEVTDAFAAELSRARRAAVLRVDVVTIFPSYLEPLELSLIGRARQAGLIEVGIHDLRDFTQDRHRTVDDAPAGGGAGMVMRPEPWGRALAEVLAQGRQASGRPDAAPLLLVPSPSGAPLTQGLARDLSQLPWLAIACGRYEGIDERVFDDAATVMPVLPISLGDYVLNGGEVAALAIIEAVGRLIPGVVGNAESLVEESHEDGLLEYPVYTRPPSWRGREIPEVLASGHHARIRRWRRDQALERTAQRRPDLIERLDPEVCDKADRAILAAAGWLIEDGRFRRATASVAD